MKRAVRYFIAIVFAPVVILVVAVALAVTFVMDCFEEGDHERG